MKNILVIGSTGQIGSELTRELRKNYGNDHVVAGYIPGAEPKGELLESGPAEIADVTNGAGIAEVVKKYNIDTIYNLAALRGEVRRVHTEFDRLVRHVNTPRHDSPRHHPASTHHVRCD